jgi:hypothetical protein
MVQAILAIQPPKGVKQLRHFLGMVQYCSKPVDQAREQHNEKKSVLILLGKSYGCKNEKVALLIAPKWTL